MKLVSSVFAAAAVISAAIVLLDPALAQQGAAPNEEQKKDGATVAAPSEMNQRMYRPENFRLDIDPAPVTKVDSLTVKQTVATDAIGDARDYQSEPGGDAVRDTAREAGPDFGRPEEQSPAGAQPRVNATPFLRSGIAARTTATVPVRQADVAVQKQDDPDEDEEDDD